MDIILSILKIGVVAYAGLCALVFARQAGYIYYPDHEESTTPADMGMRYDEVAIETEDGESLAAWFVPATEAGRPVILLCHGNAGDRADRIYIVKTLHDMGFGVLLFDYRGYGRSTGKPSEKGTYADARAAWRYLVELRGVEPGAIVIYGRSLGGAIGANLATETAPAVATFARVNLIQTLEGTPYADAPEWFTSWEKTGLISFEDKNGDGIIAYRGDPQQNELSVDRDIMVLANPEIAQLPNWVIALVAAGGLAAALSTAAGLLLVM